MGNHNRALLCTLRLREGGEGVTHSGRWAVGVGLRGCGAANLGWRTGSSVRGRNAEALFLRLARRTKEKKGSLALRLSHCGGPRSLHHGVWRLTVLSHDLNVTHEALLAGSR